MKQLISILFTLILTSNAFAGFKTSIGSDFVASQTRYQETQTFQVNGSTYNVDRIKRDDSVNLRLLLGYDIEVAETVDIGLATSYSTNNSIRYDLIAKFKPVDSIVNLKAGPSYTTILNSNDYKQSIGANFGTEVNLNKSTFLDFNLNVSQFQGPETTLEGTVTTGIGFRF